MLFYFFFFFGSKRRVFPPPLPGGPILKGVLAAILTAAVAVLIGWNLSPIHNAYLTLFEWAQSHPLAAALVAIAAAAPLTFHIVLNGSLPVAVYEEVLDQTPALNFATGGPAPPNGNGGRGGGGGGGGGRPPDDNDRRDWKSRLRRWYEYFIVIYLYLGIIALLIILFSPIYDTWYVKDYNLIACVLFMLVLTALVSWQIGPRPVLWRSVGELLNNSYVAGTASILLSGMIALAHALHLLHENSVLASYMNMRLLIFVAGLCTVLMAVAWHLHKNVRATAGEDHDIPVPLCRAAFSMALAAQVGLAGIASDLGVLIMAGASVA